MKHFSSFSLLIFTALLLPATSIAQSADYRLDRLERDIQFLQKHIYGADNNSRDGNTANIREYGGGDAAQIGVQLSEMAETISQLRGEIEQIQHQQNILADKMNRFEKDADYRFNALEMRLPAAIPPVVGGAENAIETVVAAQSAVTPPTPSTSAPVTTAEPKTDTPPAVSTGRSREEYNKAFRLLNQGNYDESAAAFEAFIDRYNNDPLLGNAYYWLGETHYVRSRHPQAADAFRRGFEAMPDGPKAPDNLYKMALSLSNVSKQKEACVVLGQLVKKYGDRDTSVILKAQQEYDRLSCN